MKRESRNESGGGASKDAHERGTLKFLSMGVTCYKDIAPLPNSSSPMYLLPQHSKHAAFASAHSSRGHDSCMLRSRCYGNSPLRLNRPKASDLDHQTLEAQRAPSLESKGIRFSVGWYRQLSLLPGRLFCHLASRLARRSSALKRPK